jgi:hypothetical protein
MAASITKKAASRPCASSTSRTPRKLALRAFHVFKAKQKTTRDQLCHILLTPGTAFFKKLISNSRYVRFAF